MQSEVRSSGASGGREVDASGAGESEDPRLPERQDGGHSDAGRGDVHGTDTPPSSALRGIDRFGARRGLDSRGSSSTPRPDHAPLSPVVIRGLDKFKRSGSESPEDAMSRSSGVVHEAPTKGTLAVPELGFTDVALVVTDRGAFRLTLFRGNSFEVLSDDERHVGDGVGDTLAVGSDLIVQPSGLGERASLGRIQGVELLSRASSDGAVSGDQSGLARNLPTSLGSDAA